MHLFYNHHTDKSMHTRITCAFTHNVKAQLNAFYIIALDTSRNLRLIGISVSTISTALFQQYQCV